MLRHQQPRQEDGWHCQFPCFPVYSIRILTVRMHRRYVFVVNTEPALTLERAQVATSMDGDGKCGFFRREIPLCLAWLQIFLGASGICTMTMKTLGPPFSFRQHSATSVAERENSKKAQPPATHATAHVDSRRANEASRLGWCYHIFCLAGTRTKLYLISTTPPISVSDLT